MGRIWLDKPDHSEDHVNPSMFNSSLMTIEQFELTHQKWHNWYTADWDYGQTTIAFFCAAIACLVLINAVVSLRRDKRSASSRTKPAVLDRLVALGRYTLACQYRVPAFDWYSPPLGAIIGVAGMFTFIMALTFAATPYYWPNMNMGHSQPIATRTGWISIAIMPFMIAFATKVNFIGMLTGTSHEKLQVFHRWSAFFMYITSLIHTFPFIIKCIEWGEMEVEWNTSQSYWTGVAALVPQTYLILMSWGLFRNRYYELFKKLHFIAATIFMVALFIHVDWIATSWDYFWGTIAVFFLAYFVRVFRTFYNSHLLGLPATAEMVSSQAVKLTIPIPAHSMKWSPGQHVFVRFLNLGVHSFSSHPFTITSISAHAETSSSGEDPNYASLKQNAVQLVFRVGDGITKALARRLKGKTSVAIGRVWIDGPYGGMPLALNKFDHVYFFAGGTGVSFTLPLLMDLVRQLNNGTATHKHIDFILTVRHSDFFDWLSEPLSLARAAGVAVHLHVTGPAERGAVADSDDVESKHSAESTTPDRKQLDTAICSRPNIAATIHRACQSDRGRISIIACGPSSFMYDVRNAVAECQLAIADGYSRCTDLFMHTENYGW